tara:strand:- start:13863 stop:14387 length:525 start_codon:yes stop_codon:yes gene_type:complete
MYLKAGEEYADGELQLLSELLAILDNKLVEISSLIVTSVDPESDGLTDRGEYFVGVGFSAIQQYLTDTLTLTGIGKSRAFDIGPIYSERLTFVAVVNAAANWWKHSAEWVWQPKQHGLALRTQGIVTEVSGTEDYPLSNVLSNLQGSSEMTLSALLSNLVLWRSAVDGERRQNA